jgi:hypothetical protein
VDSISDRTRSLLDVKARQPRGLSVSMRSLSETVSSHRSVQSSPVRLRDYPALTPGPVVPLSLHLTIKQVDDQSTIS